MDQVHWHTNKDIEKIKCSLTTEDFYAETSLLKGVKPRPVSQDFHNRFTNLHKQKETGYTKCEKKFLISPTSNNTIAWWA